MYRVVTKYFKPERSELNNILSFIKAELTGMNVNETSSILAVFYAEDLTLNLINAAQATDKADAAQVDDMIKVVIKKRFGAVKVRMSCNGTEFSYIDEFSKVFYDEFDEEITSAIISRLLASYKKDVEVTNKKGRNSVTITVSTKRRNPLILSGVSLILGIMCGLIIKLVCSEQIAVYIGTHVFDVGTEMFMDATKMIIGFLVFFSIAVGMSGFGDLREMGRTFARVNAMFGITSIITILVTYGIFTLKPIGNPALQSAVDASATPDAQGTSGSLAEMLSNIIPDNLVQAFIDVNMLQILFAAVLFGIAITQMGETGQRINHAMSAIDRLFQRVTLVVVKFMPVCIFCSMASIVIELKPSDIVSLAGWAGMIYFCDGVILCLLMVMVRVFGKTSPLWFLRQCGHVLISAFALASSNAVMPMTMNMCKEKLGVSPKIYAFSIPLGIVVNMDGGCVTLLVSALFLTKVYGITLSVVALISLFLTVFLLSVAAPAVPGGILLCLAALLPQIGVPAEGITIVIGLYFFVSMIQTMVNVTSTLASTYVVDRWEKSREL